MTFRRKLLALFALTVAVSVGGVALLVQWVTRNAFEKAENQRTASLLTQFQREFTRRGEDVARRVDAIASSDPLMRMAGVLNGTNSDFAEYFDLARGMAESRQLDFLEILDEHGKIISSAQWPAKFGYPETAFDSLSSSPDQAPFLKLEELQDNTALGLFAARTVRAGDRVVYVVGGRRLDRNFLAALDLPADMRALLYQNRGDHFSPDLLLDPAAGSAPDINHPAEKFAPLIDAVRQYNQEISGIINWSADRADEEVFHAIPLRGLGRDRPLLGILLIGNSRRSYVELKRRIRDSALLAGGGGIVLAILSEQLGLSAGDASGGGTGTRRSGRDFGKLEYQRGGTRPGRSRATCRIVQPYDIGVAGAEGTTGTDRACGSMARTGAASGART